MRAKKLFPPLNRRGLTLVEMMVSLTIFGIVLGVVFSFMAGSRESYNKTREKAQYQQTVRAVMSLVSRELRSVGCDPSDVGFDRLGLADDWQVTCRMDLNGDSDVTDTSPDETVNYQYDPVTGELSRDGGSGAQVILREVTNLAFQYYDQNGDPLGDTPLDANDRDMVRFIELAITGETSTGEEVTYTSRVAIRNI